MALINNQSPQTPCNVSLRQRNAFGLPARSARRGSIYAIVLFMSLMIGMMGMAAIHIANLTLQEATGSSDRYITSLLASSGIENGLVTIQSKVDWRTRLTSGVEYPETPIALNGGTFTWRVVDEDGHLDNDSADTVLLEGIGRLGRNVHVERVRLQPTEAGLTCLASSLHCNGGITPGYYVDITTNQTVSSNSDINTTNPGASVEGDAWAAGNISGPITGSESKYQSPARQMPKDSVFDYYLNMGTLISITALPYMPVTGSYVLERIVLSPDSNPYGTPNAEGIYVIDCAGRNLCIRNLRVNGTLVLLNTTTGSHIESEVFFHPAVSNFPSLLVKGSIKIQTNANNLYELWESTNFNPAGSPYLGSEDSDQTDVYPGKIEGLVYVSGTLELPLYTSARFKGVVVCNSISVSTNCNFEYDSTFLSMPPPGFASGNAMGIIPGSWTRTLSP